MMSTQYKTNKIQSLLAKALWLISLCIVTFLFIANIIFNVTISYDRTETVTIKSNIFLGLISLALIIVLLFVLCILKKHIEKINPNWLFCVLTLIYIALAVYFICNIDFTLRADANYISIAAKNLLIGNLEDFKAGGYLNNFPHQTGLVLYTAFLYFFTQNTAIHFIVNLIFILGTNYLLYKISDLLFHNKLTNIFTVLLSFCFLPQFFFILFAYGNVPSFFFLILAFWGTLKFLKKRCFTNMLIVFLGGSMAVFLRKNCIIGIIAIVIFLLLKLNKKDLLKHLALIILLILGSIFPLKIASSHFLDKADIKNAGVPNVLWIAMGTDIDNTDRGPGWYNGFNRTTFLKAESDPPTAQKIGVNKLKNNIEKIKQEPVRSIKFFAKKTVSQWCEPTYQSIWSGPLEDCGQLTHTKPLKSIYNGGLANNCISIFLKGYMLFLYGLLLLFIFKKGLKHSGWELFLIFLIGGFLFHIFWEAKSQYIYQYIITLIPLGAFSLSLILKKYKIYFQNHKNGEHYARD